MIKEFEKAYRELKVANEKSTAWRKDLNQIKKNDELLEEAWRNIQEYKKHLNEG